LAYLKLKKKESFEWYDNERIMTQSQTKHKEEATHIN